MRTIGLAIFAALAISPAARAQPADKKGEDIWETVFARDRDGRDHQIGYACHWNR